MGRGHFFFQYFAVHESSSSFARYISDQFSSDKLRESGSKKQKEKKKKKNLPNFSFSFNEYTCMHIQLNLYSLFFQSHSKREREKCLLSVVFISKVWPNFVRLFLPFTIVSVSVLTEKKQRLFKALPSSVPFPFRSTQSFLLEPERLPCGWTSDCYRKQQQTTEEKRDGWERERQRQTQRE